MLRDLVVSFVRQLLSWLPASVVVEAGPIEVRNHFDWAWLDRCITPYRQAKIYLGAHALHYATSAFEGIRAYRVSGRLVIWKLDEHVRRLFLSFREVGFEIPYSAEEIAQAILDIVSLNDDGQAESLYIRPFAFVNVDPETKKGLGVDPRAAQLSLGIITQPWGTYLTEGKYNDGATVLWTDRARLLPAQSVTMKQASMYGITSVPAKLEAKRYGASEALCVNLEGEALDGSGQTLCAIVVEDGQPMILTPNPVTSNILPGLTRTFLFDQVHPDHLPCRWEHVPAITKKLVRSGQVIGMFFLGTATEVTPITRVWIKAPNGGKEEIIIGNGYAHPIAVALAAFYANVVRRRVPEYDGDCTEASDRDKVVAKLLIAGNLVVKKT